MKLTLNTVKSKTIYAFISSGIKNVYIVSVRWLGKTSVDSNGDKFRVAEIMVGIKDSRANSLKKIVTIDSTGYFRIS